MTHHARLVKTLGSLVIAMTTTSALLGWIDPSPSAPESVPSYESMLAPARGVVGDDVSIRLDQWASVGVVPGPASTPNRLVATANRVASHFVVDLDGRFTRTPHWERQQHLPDAPSSVTIEVECAAEGRPMTRAQWYAVRALFAAVTSLVAPEGLAMPMHLHGEWARLYRVEPGEDLSRRQP